MLPVQTSIAEEKELNEKSQTLYEMQLPKFVEAHEEAQQAQELADSKVKEHQDVVKQAEEELKRLQAAAYKEIEATRAAAAAAAAGPVSVKPEPDNVTDQEQVIIDSDGDIAGADDSAADAVDSSTTSAGPSSSSRKAAMDPSRQAATITLRTKKMENVLELVKETKNTIALITAVETAYDFLQQLHEQQKTSGTPVDAAVWTKAVNDVIAAVESVSKNVAQAMVTFQNKTRRKVRGLCRSLTRKNNDAEDSGTVLGKRNEPEESEAKKAEEKEAKEGSLLGAVSPFTEGVLAASASRLAGAASATAASAGAVAASKQSADPTSKVVTFYWMRQQKTKFKNFSDPNIKPFDTFCPSCNEPRETYWKKNCWSWKCTNPICPNKHRTERLPPESNTQI